MKTKLYAVALLVSLALFFAFTQPALPPTLDEVRQNILLNTCLTPNRGAEDENTVTITSIFLNEREVVKAVPQNQCEGSPAYKYYGLVIALDEEAYWNWAAFYGKRSKFSQNFKALFGVEPIQKIIPLPSEKGLDEQYGFRFFNPQALKIAFDKLYVKPTTQFQKLTYQKIYDISLKDYFRDATMLIAEVLKNKPLFERLAKEYFEKAQKETNFEGQILTQTYEQKHYANVGQSQCVYFNRILGMMLRRQTDGSLKVMLEALKTILKDYDPETYNRFKDKI
ncbi:MAG: hypothetical protein NZ551_03235 [Microscillaceae bacterium]|nr:hypothetical protein [Microscillaceae bacterium]MDW8460202.1 hypothetical protein [Cytophagales bacterium]